MNGSSRAEIDTSHFTLVIPYQPGTTSRSGKPCWGGSGTPFPIGISQLVKTYAGIPGMVSGSDHYMGEATLTTMSDLYVINAFMDAVHDADQPLTSLEFEAGSGDYGAGVPG